MEIALLQGGNSPERPISLKTGGAVAQALGELGHSVTLLEPDRVSLKQLLKQAFDFCFIALHGKGGEDGTVQGLLECLDLPYNGSGVLASALCMDKPAAKALFRERGLATPDYQELRILKTGERDLVGESLSGAPLSFAQLAATLHLPFVLKPPSLGSTLGVEIVASEADFAPALASAAAFEGRVLAERFVPGREVTVALLGDEALPAMEIEIASPLYSFQAKYESGQVNHYIPPRLSTEEVRACAELSQAAARAAGCSGVVRADLRVDSDGKPWLLELNTLPGLTEVSLVPESARAAGISFPDLVRWMVTDGIRKKEKAFQK